MVKACHLVVKLGDNAISEKRNYKVILRDGNDLLHKVLTDQAEFIEATYSNVDYKNLYWGDVTGDSIEVKFGTETGSRLYFAVNNPGIGWPSARVGFNQDPQYNNGHNFSEGESYTWILDNRHYRITRNSDSNNKEFVLEIDVS